MVGYEGEDTNFALELTYNYGIDCKRSPPRTRHNAFLSSLDLRLRRLFLPSLLQPMQLAQTCATSRSALVPFVFRTRQQPARTQFPPTQSREGGS